MATYKTKLLYFDFEGRAEPVRIALHIAGVDFEDARVKFPDWAAVKPTTPYGAIPTLEVDGKVYAQSNAILRYAGTLAGIHPKDPLKALKADELMDFIEDLYHQFSASFRVRGEEQKKIKRSSCC